MDAGGFRQAAQVAWIRGKDVAAISGQARHGGVDGIGLASAGQQHPRAATKIVIDRDDIGPGEQPRGWRLAPTAAAPHLRGHSPARHRHPAGEPLPLISATNVGQSPRRPRRCPVSELFTGRNAGKLMLAGSGRAQHRTRARATAITGATGRDRAPPRANVDPAFPGGPAGHRARARGAAAVEMRPEAAVLPVADVDR